MDGVDSVQPIVEIRHLGKKFGRRKILSDINVDVYGGEILGFLGPNGSGKTTTIKLMLGLLKIKEGSVKICGHDITTDFEAATACVGGIIENPEMYKHLSGYQNLMQYARMYDDPPSKEYIDSLVRTVRLESRIHDKISKYSLGMRQRLGVAQALLGKPKLLILDEPTNGLDPEGIRFLRDMLKDLAHNQGVAVFVSSHMLAELELMCDRVYVIDKGVVVGTHILNEKTAGTVEEETSVAEAEKQTVPMSTYRIGVLDAESALRLLRDAGYSCALYRGESKDTDMAAAVGDADIGKTDMHGIENEIVALMPVGEISDVISKLVLGGVSITKVLPVQRSLEDIFLEMTQKYVPGGDKA